jgi:hypothetical protein
MTCPNCKRSFPVTITIRGLTVCSFCDASIVISTGQRATAAETLLLTLDELAALRKVRSQGRKSRQQEAGQ